MDREKLFLSLVARSRQDEKTKARIKSLSAGGLDWSSVMKTAERQSLLPLLNYNRCHVRKMPKGALKKSARRAKETIILNMLIFEEAKKIIRALKESGISPIVLNGIPSAKKYKKDCLMLAGTIDLLIKKDDIGLIEDVLYTEGWETTDMRYPLTKRARLRRGCRLPKFSNGNAELCLHWGIASGINAEPEELREGALGLNLDGVAALQLSAESQIINLCLRSASFRRQGNVTKGLVDLNETISFYGKNIGWDALAEKANRWGANKITHKCLSLTKKLFENELIPAEKLDALKRS